MPPHPKPASHKQDDGQAEEVAILALGFIAGDDERLSRFLALTGIDPASIRSQIGERGFQLAILDHLFEDESLLLSFCAEINMDPARLVSIHHRMKPENHHGLRDG